MYITCAKVSLNLGTTITTTPVTTAKITTIARIRLKGRFAFLVNLLSFTKSFRSKKFIGILSTKAKQPPSIKGLIILKT